MLRVIEKRPGRPRPDPDLCAQVRRIHLSWCSFVQPRVQSSSKLICASGRRIESCRAYTDGLDPGDAESFVDEVTASEPKRAAVRRYFEAG